MNYSKRRFLRYAALFSFTLLLIESLIYGYFILQIYKGTCFYLIGHQKLIDNLIKVRLTYSIYYAQGKKNFLHRVDEDLGYTVGTDKESSTYKTNKQGFRAEKEYGLIPEKDILRVSTFGDSFTYGHGEKNNATWQYQLENMVGNIEILNFGVPGFGLGQSYLRYLKDGSKFNSDIIFFNYILTTARDRLIPSEILSNGNLRVAHFYRVRFMVENDRLLTDNLTPFDFFNPAFREEHLYKPLGVTGNPPFWRSKIFSISNLGLLIKQQAFRKRFSIYHVNSEYSASDEKVNLIILKQLLYTAKKTNASVLFFYESPFEELPQSIQEILIQNKSYVHYVDAKSSQYSPYNIEVRKISNLYNKSSHWNAEGNQYYAKAIFEVLKSHKWGKGERRFRYNVKTNSFQNISK